MAGKDDEDRARRKELMRSMTAELDKSGLTSGQKAFCFFYVQSHNATQAYAKAFKCTIKAAGASGHRLLKKAEIKKEIKRLRKLLAESYDVDADEMVRFLLKVVGADIGDYLTFQQQAAKPDDDAEDDEAETVNAVTLKDSSMVDTSLIKSVKQSSRGVVNLELYDKMQAWQRLDRFFGFTAEHQAKEGSGQLNLAEAITKARHRAEAAAEEEGWETSVQIIDDVADEPKDWKEGLERAGVNVASMTAEELAELQKIIAKHGDK